MRKEGTFLSSTFFLSYRTHGLNLRHTTFHNTSNKSAYNYLTTLLSHTGQLKLPLLVNIEESLIVILILCCKLILCCLCFLVQCSEDF